MTAKDKGDGRPLASRGAHGQALAMIARRPIARRPLALAFVIALAAGLGLIGWSYRTALADPVVRRAELALLPPDAPVASLRLVLVSDIHVAGPDMLPARLDQLVAQINALKPDLVLMAGDFVSDKPVASRRYRLAEAIAPLASLNGRLGRFAVLGNHDHWRDAATARRELTRAGVTVLNNNAVRVGPLAIGGLDDAFTRHEDVGATVAAMRQVGGVPILLSHSPDPFARVPDDIVLTLAGHTHCGQIRLPLVGAIVTMSDYGDRYACGLVVERGRRLIVGAGVGTSLLPLRLGAVPDMWLITLTRAPG